MDVSVVNARATACQRTVTSNIPVSVTAYLRHLIIRVTSTLRLGFDCWLTVLTDRRVDAPFCIRIVQASSTTLVIQVSLPKTHNIAATKLIVQADQPTLTTLCVIFFAIYQSRAADLVHKTYHLLSFATAAMRVRMFVVYLVVTARLCTRVERDTVAAALFSHCNRENFIITTHLRSTVENDLSTTLGSVVRFWHISITAAELSIRNWSITDIVPHHRRGANSPGAFRLAALLLIGAIGVNSADNDVGCAQYSGHRTVAGTRLNMVQIGVHTTHLAPVEAALLRAATALAVLRAFRHAVAVGRSA